MISRRLGSVVGFGVLSASWVLACSDGERQLRLRDTAGAPGPTPVFVDGASANGASDVTATGSGGTNTTSAASSDSTTGWVIPADSGFHPTESIACGDGVRDALLEECDDGVGSDNDACTPDCQVNDFLVDTWPGSEEVGDFAPEHRLGEGRHPIASGDRSFAVAYLEQDENSELKVKVARFTDQG